MSEISQSIEPPNQPRTLSRWAVASMVFVGVATFSMVISKQLPIPHGWDNLGRDAMKGLLYLGGCVSMLAAIVCSLIAIRKNSVRQWEVSVSVALCALAPASHYVIYEWWPTPEMLVIAAADNDFPRVKRCLAFGVDINVISPHSRHPLASQTTALMVAVGQRHVAMVDFLIDHGANPNRETSRGRSPMSLATLRHPDLADRLINSGGNIQSGQPLDRLLDRPNLPNSDLADCEKQIRFVVSRGALISDSLRLKAMNRVDLRLAVLLETLLREKSVPNSNPQFEFLSALAFGEDDAATKVLREHPEVIDIRLANQLGKRQLPSPNSTFTIAIRFGRVGPLREWLHATSQADANFLKYIVGPRNFCTAAKHGHIDVMKLLLEYGADLSANRKPDGNALHCAVRYGHQNAANWLINQGIEMDVPIHADLADTPLKIACEKGNRELVELLVAKGADLNIEFGNPRKALIDYVTERKRQDIADVLRSHGAKSIRLTQ